MDEIENKVNEFLNAQNRTPLEDFDGFTAEDMQYIIHNPFTEMCTIKVNATLASELLRHSPIFNIVLDLLLIINNNNGIKLTPKGNIQQKVLRELYDKKFITQEIIEAGYQSIRTEEDWVVLHTIKVVLKVAGIVRNYKGKLVLVNHWKSVLNSQKYSKIFNHFFTTYSTEFNWAYNDGHEIEETGQVGFLYLLYLLKKYGQQFRDIHFYSTKYFKAFPTLAFGDKDPEEDERYNKSERVLDLRFFERFVLLFGFGEKRIDSKKPYYQRKIEIKKTTLLDSLLLS
jgi:hypothetical protein